MRDGMVRRKRLKKIENTKRNELFIEERRDRYLFQIEYEQLDNK